MSNLNEENEVNTQAKDPSEIKEDVAQSSSKGPLSYLSGALTSGLLAWLCFGLSQKVAIYFISHAPNYNSAIAQSIATGFKTLIVGICFLATFTFGFIGLGLTLVFIRSLFDGKTSDSA